MSGLLHFATCPTWETGVGSDCSCQGDPDWRIRKDVGEQFPWRIYRRTGDQVYEPFMRASSFNRALQMVAGLDWLKHHGLRGSNNA